MSPPHDGSGDRPHSTWAADGIAAIARNSESDSVRLRAFRAIFSDIMAVSKYSGLEGRMAEIEEQLFQRDGAASSTIAIRTQPRMGQGATPLAMLPVTSCAAGAG